MNPAIATESPSNENSMDIVDKMAGRSIAIFAVILVVIQFALGGGNDLLYYESLALTTLIMAAGFLTITFASELFADLKILWFRIQLTSLRYSGLLLFLGLVLLLKSRSIPNTLSNMFGAFVAISWLAWIYHEYRYIFKIQRRTWNTGDITRKEWLKDFIKDRIPF